MTSWTSLPTEEAFITLRALGRVALTVPVVPNGVGHPERRVTPDKESIGGVPTFAWPPASEQPGSR